jgi:adenine-specific DNA-methyltransferase
LRHVTRSPEARNDTGSAARFFYCAKASREDRNVGGAENTHPTVKPTELMRYLVRLVTPPGGTVLDPFAGSGSTGRAADLEGFDAILIELLAEHAAIARRRIHGDAPLFAEVAQSCA